MGLVIEQFYKSIILNSSCVPFQPFPCVLWVAKFTDVLEIWGDWQYMDLYQAYCASGKTDLSPSLPLSRRHSPLACPSRKTHGIGSLVQNSHWPIHHVAFSLSHIGEEHLMRHLKPCINASMYIWLGCIWVHGTLHNTSIKNSENARVNQIFCLICCERQVVMKCSLTFPPPTGNPPKITLWPTSLGKHCTSVILG